MKFYFKQIILVQIDFNADFFRFLPTFVLGILGLVKSTRSILTILCWLFKTIFERIIKTWFTHRLNSFEPNEICVSEKLFLMRSVYRPFF